MNKPSKVIVASSGSGVLKNLSEQTLTTLREAYSKGCSDMEACMLAGISPHTLVAYMKGNPKFVEEREVLKEKQILIARETVNKSLATDVDTAKWYLERKKKGEFSAKAELNVNVDINDSQLSEEQKVKLDKLLATLP